MFARFLLLFWSRLWYGRRYGSYARRLSSTEAAEAGAEYKLCGPIYSVCWTKPALGNVQIQFINPKRDHKLKVTLFQNRLLEITVVEGLVLPAKTHLHIHL